MNGSIRLDTLRLSNFRCFEKYDVEFHPECTVLVARNGGGKSAVLDAIAVALGPFVGAFDEGKDQHFTVADVRLNQNPARHMKEMEPQYPVSIKATGMLEGNQIEWRRELSSAKSHTTFAEATALREYGKELQTLVRRHMDVTLPHVSYYGTGRLWHHMRLTKAKKEESTSRTRGYSDALEPASNYRMFEEWFKNLHLAEYEAKDEDAKREEVQGYLTGVRNAVNTALHPAGWGNIRYGAAEAGVLASHERYGDLPVDSLSDGIRNMIGMVADIAYRMVRLNPHLKAEGPRETPGIVLIDEVDMHLHPEWQQVVIQSLRAAFPCIQFVVTTHSPQVLTTVRRDMVRLLESEEGKTKSSLPVNDAFGRESRVALEDLMRVNSRPPVEASRVLEEYRDLIERGQIDSPEALALRRRVEEFFGPGSEELEMADLVIARWKAIQMKQGRAV